MPQTQPDGEPITVIFSDNLDRRYAVSRKSYPSLPDKHKTRPVKWVARFGFKPKPGTSIAQNQLDSHGFMKGSLEESYTIRLTKDGDALVYFDGSQVGELDYEPRSAQPGDMVEATLSAGDPAVGWT